MRKKHAAEPFVAIALESRLAANKVALKRNDQLVG
jgi:hypothetical protein